MSTRLKIQFKIMRIAGDYKPYYEFPDITIEGIGTYMTWGRKILPDGNDYFWIVPFDSSLISGYGFLMSSPGHRLAEEIGYHNKNSVLLFKLMHINKIWEMLVNREQVEKERLLFDRDACINIIHETKDEEYYGFKIPQST